MSINADAAADRAPDSAGVQLADQIARDVAASKASPGAVIASETELRALHSAGRPVFRQAIRILEERGIAFMRRGHGGGLVVSEPNADFAGRALSIVIESLTDDLRALSLLPKAVDAHLFLYSARSISLEKCEELRRLAHRLDRLSDEEFLRTGAHRRLHKAIRTASGEPAVALGHRTATEYGIDVIPYSVNVAAEGSKGEAWRITYDTAEALIAGDAARMFDCRRRQLEMFRASWPQWSAIDRDPGLAPKINDPDRPEFQLAGNRAERLAREILREIRLNGWKAGERIGGGAELIARYGATTPVLRQAVRMLQEHRAVEVERGRTGGVFVAVPDRPRAVAHAKAFLRHGAAAPEDVEAFLLNIMLEALDGGLIIRKEDLRKALAPTRGVTFGALSTAIALTSANPPLDIFVEILLPFLPVDQGATVTADMVAETFASGDLAQRRRILLACARQAPPSSFGR